MNTFPVLVTEAIVTALTVSAIAPDPTSIHRRILTETDSNGSIGIACLTWGPQLDHGSPYEMGGFDNFEPVNQQYDFTLMAMIKSSNREIGEETHQDLARSIRLMLYRNPALQLALAEMTVVLDRTERFQGLRVAQQRFGSGDFGTAGLVFLSNTTFTVATETV